MAKMHADEVETDSSLVRRLVAEQFPKWADLPVQAVPSAGTDNALYRLGECLSVRMPRIHWAVGQVAKEWHWLPLLAPHLPLKVPTPVATGKPAAGYPWPWGVYQWLNGENANLNRLTDPCSAAKDLARFVRALESIGPTDGPAAGPENFSRGVPLALRDVPTREAITALEGVLDLEAVTSAWERALRAPVRTEAPVWVHGDLQPGNLLMVDGQLSAVIDFGGLGVGDPACDLIVAWNLFEGESRAAYRTALGVDDATWERGKGWALSIGLIALPYYRETNPGLAAMARRMIDGVLGDG